MSDLNQIYLGILGGKRDPNDPIDFMTAVNNLNQKSEPELFSQGLRAKKYNKADKTNKVNVINYAIPDPDMADSDTDNVYNANFFGQVVNNDFFNDVSSNKSNSSISDVFKSDDDSSNIEDKSDDEFNEFNEFIESDESDDDFFNKSDDDELIIKTNILSAEKSRKNSNESDISFSDISDVAEKGNKLTYDQVII
jgi:hypothetical protein